MAVVVEVVIEEGRGGVDSQGIISGRLAGVSSSLSDDEPRHWFEEEEVIYKWLLISVGVGRISCNFRARRKVTEVHSCAWRCKRGMEK